MAESTFTIRVDDALKEAFAEAAKTNDRTGAQLVRDFMRDYVQRARDSADYEEWFRQEVEAGLADMRAGRLVSNEEVERQAAEWRAELLKRVAAKAEA